MTKEEKELLIIDLSTRLPYGVFVEYDYGDGVKRATKFHGNYLYLMMLGNLQWKDFKPYLRPMSSMTEDEREEYRKLGGVMSYDSKHDIWAICTFTPEAYDWLNKKMFDYRGLIPMGLAMEAPEDMYSIMDYEKAYRGAIERAKAEQETFIKGGNISGKSAIERIFPELCESDDEKIRKAQLDYWRSVGGKEWHGVPVQEVIAWLEKQDEQNYTDKVEPKFKVGDWVVDKHHLKTYQVFSIDNSEHNYIVYSCKPLFNTDRDWPCFHEDTIRLWTIQDAKDGDILEFGDHGRLVIGIASYVNKTTGKVDVNCLLENNNFKVGNYYNLDTIKPHPATEEQRDLLFQKMKEAGYEWDDEKKELKKIEPKFKVGDCVVYNRNDSSREILYVYDIRDSRYYFNDNIHLSWSVKACDEKCHLWTIHDAKDGDILMANAPFIFNGNLEDGIGCPGAHCGINTLGKFQIPKRQEHWTGHTTTPATKEQRDLLFQKMKDAGYEWDNEKKELKKLEQTSAWSEEDEERIEFLIAMCDDEQAECVNNSTMYRECTETKDWLKSIKPNHWKPSKEQMNALDKAKNSSANYYDIRLGLQSLYNDLIRL